MLILCLKYKTHENLVSSHLYVNSIYCYLKVTMKQKLMTKTQNLRMLKIAKTIFLAKQKKSNSLRKKKVALKLN